MGKEQLDEILQKYRVLVSNLSSRDLGLDRDSVYEYAAQFFESFAAMQPQGAKPVEKPQETAEQQRRRRRRRRKESNTHSDNYSGSEPSVEIKTTTRSGKQSFSPAQPQMPPPPSHQQQQQPPPVFQPAANDGSPYYVYQSGVHQPPPVQPQYQYQYQPPQQQPYSIQQSISSSSSSGPGYPFGQAPSSTAAVVFNPYLQGPDPGMYPPPAWQYSGPSTNSPRSADVAARLRDELAESFGLGRARVRIEFPDQQQQQMSPHRSQQQQQQQQQQGKPGSSGRKDFGSQGYWQASGSPRVLIPKREVQALKLPYLEPYRSPRNTESPAQRSLRVGLSVREAVCWDATERDSRHVLKVFLGEDVPSDDTTPSSASSQSRTERRRRRRHRHAAREREREREDRLNVAAPMVVVVPPLSDLSERDEFVDSGNSGGGMLGGGSGGARGLATEDSSSSLLSVRSSGQQQGGLNSRSPRVQRKQWETPAPGQYTLPDAMRVRSPTRLSSSFTSTTPRFAGAKVPPLPLQQAPPQQQRAHTQTLAMMDAQVRQSQTSLLSGKGGSTSSLLGRNGPGPGGIVSPGPSSGVVSGAVSPAAESNINTGGASTGVAGTGIAGSGAGAGAARNPRTRPLSPVFVGNVSKKTLQQWVKKHSPRRGIGL